MKSNFKRPLFWALPLALAWIGCQTQAPTSYPHLSSPAAVVLNFDSPWSSTQTIPAAQPASGPVTDSAGSPVTTLTVNATLAEANRSPSVVQTPGVLIPTGSPLVSPQILGPGANNTPYCVHMGATFTDPANGSYPMVLLSIPLEASGNHYYDASLFTGVKFYIKVMGDDTVSTRSFQIPIAPTTPTSQGGTCTASGGGCYANFSYTFPTTNGAWQLVNLPFTSITRQSYGVPISPSTLSGVNLTEILSLQWSEGNNNVAGTVTADFYVDEVQFF